MILHRSRPELPTSDTSNKKLQPKVTKAGTSAASKPSEPHQPSPAASSKACGEHPCAVSDSSSHEYDDAVMQSRKHLGWQPKEEPSQGRGRASRGWVSPPGRVSSDPLSAAPVKRLGSDSGARAACDTLSEKSAFSGFKAGRHRERQDYKGLKRSQTSYASTDRESESGGGGNGLMHHRSVTDHHTEGERVEGGRDSSTTTSSSTLTESEYRSLLSSSQSLRQGSRVQSNLTIHRNEVESEYSCTGSMPSTALLSLSQSLSSSVQSLKHELATFPRREREMERELTDDSWDDYTTATSASATEYEYRSASSTVNLKQESNDESGQQPQNKDDRKGLVAPSPVCPPRRTSSRPRDAGRTNGDQSPELIWHRASQRSSLAQVVHSRTEHYRGEAGLHQPMVQRRRSEGAAKEALSSDTTLSSEELLSYTSLTDNEKVAQMTHHPVKNCDRLSPKASSRIAGCAVPGRTEATVAGPSARGTESSAAGSVRGMVSQAKGLYARDIDLPPHRELGLSQRNRKSHSQGRGTSSSVSDRDSPGRGTKPPAKELQTKGVVISGKDRNLPRRGANPTMRSQGEGGRGGGGGGGAGGAGLRSPVQDAEFSRRASGLPWRERSLQSFVPSEAMWEAGAVRANAQPPVQSSSNAISVRETPAQVAAACQSGAAEEELRLVKYVGGGGQRRLETVEETTQWGDEEEEEEEEEDFRPYPVDDGVLSQDYDRPRRRGLPERQRVLQDVPMLLLSDPGLIVVVDDQDRRHSPRRHSPKSPPPPPFNAGQHNRMVRSLCQHRRHDGPCVATEAFPCTCGSCSDWLMAQDNRSEDNVIVDFLGLPPLCCRPEEEGVDGAEVDLEHRRAQDDYWEDDQTEFIIADDDPTQLRAAVHRNCIICAANCCRDGNQAMHEEEERKRAKEEERRMMISALKKENVLLLENARALQFRQVFCIVLVFMVYAYFAYYALSAWFS